MRISRLRSTGSPDYIITFCIASLVIFGLVMLASASSHLGKLKFDDSYYYLKHQLLYGLSVGIIGFLFASKIYYRYYEKIAIVLLVISIVLLVLVFTPLGVDSGGAERWLKLGPISFQPSEILKITFIFYLAAWLGNNPKRTKSFSKGFLPFLMVSAVISGLLIKQPATSAAALLMAVGLIIYFVSGARLSYILAAITAGGLALAIIVLFTPYRLTRITSFFNQDANPQVEGYHINQAKIAIGSGGLWGVGYGQSTMKVKYLPEPIGDSIFAIVAEEFGFAGSLTLIMIFLILSFKILWLSRKVRDKFAQLLLIGFGSLIATQALVNIGAISGILPLTGMPLPFISYGGTALAVFMTIGGIIVNISRHAQLTTNN